MEKEKMNLQEATLKALYDELDDSKDVNDVEGIVDNILVVTDPKVNSEEYEEVIERAQEIVEDTPEGEIPFDEEWEGQYLQTCPICGATFVTDEILEPGAICPVCTQVPEAFVMVGRVETDETVAEENGINQETEEEEEGTEFAPETFEDAKEEKEDEEEKVEASEEVKSADNKLEETKALNEDVDILEEDKLNFKKYGIERFPEEDFSDDGNHFRGYICNGVPISYLKDDGQVYLSIRVDYLEGLTYNEYSKLPSYKDCDKYNGVSDSQVDLADVAEICKRIKAEYEEALKDVKEVSDDDYKAYVDKYYEKAKREFEEAKNELKVLGPEDLLNASEWDLKDLKSYLQRVKDEIEYKNWDKKSKDSQITRRYNLDNDSKEQYERVSWYLQQIKEIVKKITSKRTESLEENKEQDIKDILEIINEDKEEHTQSYLDLLEQLNELIAMDATDKEFDDFLNEASFNEEITNNEFLALQKRAQQTRMIETKLDEAEIKADYNDLKALRTASEALQDLWDTIEGGESEFLGTYKSDIATASDTIDNILKAAELSNKEESKLEESEDDKIKAFEDELEKVGITTTNKLYFVTGTPESCHTVEEADEYYEILPKWDSTNYWRDRGDITQEQFELIDKNRDLAKAILKRSADMVNSYGPLD